MADMNNFSEINDNFDTIKTLLNSIRAQGILNTSDVDKLLEGINTKLDKINTEEDIDLIKAFLSELKQNLDERHNVLISKFGAIESLFSNLLKNSTESAKTSEIKELFDIIATNLSVFSKEVVTQKESLTDIVLRLDAMRSDDSQKKDIIKSITSVRNDVEKLNNGFDSIVISLNENFKTVLKTVAEIDQSEAITGFAAKLNDILTSSNSVLSAIQLLDKKNINLEDALETVATKSDTSEMKKNLLDLSAQSKEISELVEVLTQKSYKVDNLSDKIDAAVNIIAGLKAEIAEKEDSSKDVILDRIELLESSLQDISNAKDFEEFKTSLNATLKDISSNSETISADIINVGEGVKEKFVTETEKLSQLIDVNITRTLNDIASNADVLNSRLKETHTNIASLCEKNFADVTEGLTTLKEVLSQLDENNISANNAIFSNITDRLAIFENSLKSSLEKQEDYVSTSSNSLVEQIRGIKTVTENIDYKLDSSSIELTNSKKEFEELKESVNNMLALDFVNTIKELKVDLYAVKQDLAAGIENAQGDLSEKYTNDLFGKYELLISKLDAVEDELKYAQADAMSNLKNTLTSISDSIVDVLSYVSVQKSSPEQDIDLKLQDVVESVKDSNLNYIENVKDVLDIIRIKIENNLKQLGEDSEQRLQTITTAISESNLSLKLDLQKSYDKLSEVQEAFSSIKEALNLNNITMSTNFDNVLNVSDTIKDDFDAKLISLKNTLLDKVTEFKNDFTCENADKLSELKFNNENLYSRTVQQSEELKNELKAEVDQIVKSLKLNIAELNESVAETSLKIESANNEVIQYIRKDFADEVNNSVDTIKSNTSEVLSDMDSKVTEVVDNFKSLENSVKDLTADTKSSLASTLGKILENFVSFKALLGTFNEQNIDKTLQFADDLKNEIENVKQDFIDNKNDIERSLDYQRSIIDENFTSLEQLVNSIDTKSKENLKLSVEGLKNDFSALKKRFNDVDKLIDEDLSRQVSIIEGNFESLNLMLVDIMNQTTEKLGDKIKQELSGASSKMSETLAEELEQYKTQIEELFDTVKNENNIQADFIKEKILELNSILNDAIEKQNKYSVSKLNDVTDNLKTILNDSMELASADYKSLKLKIEEFYKDISETNDALIDSVKAQLDDIVKFVDSNLDVQAQEINTSFDEISSGIQSINAQVIDFNKEFSEKIGNVKEDISNLEANISKDIQLKYSDMKSKAGANFESLSDSIKELKEETNESIKSNSGIIVDSLNSIIKDFVDGSAENVLDKVNDLQVLLENSFTSNKSIVETQAKDILDEILSIHSTYVEHNNKLKQLIDKDIKQELSELSESLKNLFEENSMNFVAQLGNTNTQLSEELSSGVLQFKAEFESLNTRLDKDEISRMNVYQAQIKELSSTFNDLIEGSKELTKSEIASISEVLIKNSQVGMEEIEQSIDEKINTLLATSADITAGELQTIESFSNMILDKVESVKQNSIVCKDLITNLLKERFELILKDIEKETDVVTGDIIEQFDILKDGQKDELIRLTSDIEGSVSGYISDAVDNIKNYLDVTTDQSLITEKLDSLKSELEESFRDTAKNINKLLKASIFTDSISDLKSTNTILIESLSEDLSSSIEDFILTNVSEKFDKKFDIFGKEFTDTVIEKYEEVKNLSGKYNDSINNMSSTVNGLLDELAASKNSINSNIEDLTGTIGSSIVDIKNSLDELKSQIINKSSDVTFLDSVNNQISGIADLVQEQMGYIEDISELCCTNLPEITEMNTIIKYGIQQSISEIKEKVNSQDSNLPTELNKLKSEIITQFLNIFNQISFVAEQEEIIDFIQEKHSELITILSHIVTTIDDVETVKDNLAVVDNKVEALKEDIGLINEKITAIMSSEGDIDYVYSLQDLESDIANLRLVLNEMKNGNSSKDLEELVNSTNSIYKLVETIKSEMPKFEADEFKKDFETLSEDIVSISARTNKLLLTSDESYKTLQENLQDFKLVINDLDERTRNFSQEAGIDRIDNKLAALNTMMQNGAKTNQVFNQVFEYLAEWVDKAGEKIATISDKVETLDDISQIKVMLEDLRAESQDNSESAELVEALSNVFEKQAKRIASLEAKLDRMIVDSTINSRNNKIDMTPIEDTLNKFLVAIDDRMVLQQAKIKSLDEKLEEVVSLVDNKDTAQLSKKVGGMDKQLAKLNKSIEKIASNVIDK